MTTLAADAPVPAARPASSVRLLALAAGAVLAAFTAFSLWVVDGHGYTGFLALAGREPWALQMLLDLAIALSFAVGWMRADAKRRGLATWPYLVATLFLGSIGLLAYVVRRGLAAPAASPERG